MEEDNKGIPWWVLLILGVIGIGWQAAVLIWINWG